MYDLNSILFPLLSNSFPISLPPYPIPYHPSHSIHSNTQYPTTHPSCSMAIILFSHPLFYPFAYPPTHSIPSPYHPLQTLHPLFSYPILSPPLTTLPPHSIPSLNYPPTHSTPSPSHPLHTLHPLFSIPHSIPSQIF